MKSYQHNCNPTSFSKGIPGLHILQRCNIHFAHANRTNIALFMCKYMLQV